MVYDLTSFTTVEFIAIIAPSPIFTPGMIVTFCPIHTSLPITVPPLKGNYSILGVTFSQPSPIY